MDCAEDTEEEEQNGKDDYRQDTNIIIGIVELNFLFLFCHVTINGYTPLHAEWFTHRRVLRLLLLCAAVFSLGKSISTLHCCAYPKFLLLGG